MRRMLAATDLSPRSDRAARRAADLARSLGAELLLLYVVDDDQPVSLLEAERREVQALLRRRASELAEVVRNPAPQVLVETGGAFGGIIHAAETQAADLVVLGAHRRSLLRDIFVGTTVERVMRYGRHPVLMVNQPPAGPYRRILAATALDAASAHALRRMATLGLLDGMDLTVLHAFQASGQAVAGSLAATAQAAQAELARFLAGIELDGRDGRGPPRMISEEGRPATVIKEVAGRLRPDLLLMGTGQHGVLPDVFLGSVAAEVVAGLECDVLVVPPEQPR